MVASAFRCIWIPERMVDLRLGLKNFSLLRPIRHLGQGRIAGRPAWRAFLTWQAYYSASLRTDGSRALIQHDGPYVGDFNRQAELIDAIVAGRGPAVVCAPPGCGKSRFALELARRIERESGRWQIVFVQHDETAVREELPQLMQSKRVVFVVDDAHRCPELVRLLAAACAQGSEAGSPYLVCLTRATGRAQVTREINSPFPSGSIQEIDLGRPSPQLVRTLIDQLLPRSSPHHRDTIARFVRESYFGAVLVCGILSREAKLPQTFQRNDLRDRICREVLRAVTDGVCPIENALCALAVHAALAPVSKTSADVRDWAAQSSGLTPPTVDTLLERALDTGLFVQYGNSLVGPAADPLGDLLLEAACLDVNGKPTAFGMQMLAQLLETEPAAAARNCADIGQLFAGTRDIDLISRLILERARTIPPGSQSEALELLRAQPFAVCRPATVVDLAAILEERGILRRNPPAAELTGINSLEVAACALLMKAGEADSRAVPSALGLARDLHAASREDARSRELVLGKLEACCRFGTGRSLAHARAVVDTLQAWAGERDIGTAALSASLSARFLALTVEDGNDEQRTAAWSRSPLNPLAEVRDVRDAATETLTRAMAHGEATVQRTAIESLERYADGQEEQDPAWWERWLPQLGREMERLTAAIIKAVQPTAPLCVAAAAELRAWHWWAQERDLLHHAGATILRAIPDTDAYRLWKLLHALPLPVCTAIPEPTPTLPPDRLQHVQALTTQREEDTAAQARRLFDALDPRYPDTGAWRGLWLATLEHSPRMTFHRHVGDIAGEFARRHPEVAWSFVNQADAEGPLFAILPFLLAELGKLDRARRSQEAGRVPPGTRLEEAWLHALSFTSDLDEPERAILARGLRSTDSDTVHHAADALLAGGGAGKGTAFRRVFGVIAHRPADDELWALALQQFVSWAGGVLPPRLDKPADEMIQAADELTTLLQTQGSHLRWGFQRHTRQLPDVLAILAVLRPRRLQQWMQREWGQADAQGGRWSDESPLSVRRLPEIMRLIADSPPAAQWIETFLGWIRYERRLGGAAALGLAELCSSDDARISELARVIAAHPTDASQKALAEFVSQRQRRERPGAERLPPAQDEEFAD